MEELKAKRIALYKQLKSSHNLLVRAHSLCEALERRYNSDKLAYQECDKQLALLDGRFQVVHAEAKQLSMKLTRSQILQIAEELGIKLKE